VDLGEVEAKRGSARQGSLKRNCRRSFLEGILLLETVEGAGLDHLMGNSAPEIPLKFEPNTLQDPRSSYGHILAP
jgi:hypothetical protein